MVLSAGFETGTETGAETGAETGVETGEGCGIFASSVAQKLITSEADMGSALRDFLAAHWMMCWYAVLEPASRASRSATAACL